MSGGEPPPDGNHCLDESAVCAHAGMRVVRIGRRGGWAGQRGETVSTHANEGDKLLIRVFIRAVGRDKRAPQLLRGGFSRCMAAFRDPDTTT